MDYVKDYEIQHQRALARYEFAESFEWMQNRQTMKTALVAIVRAAAAEAMYLYENREFIDDYAIYQAFDMVTDDFNEVAVKYFEKNKLVSIKRHDVEEEGDLHNADKSE